MSCTTCDQAKMNMQIHRHATTPNNGVVHRQASPLVSRKSQQASQYQERINMLLKLRGSEQQKINNYSVKHIYR